MSTVIGIIGAALLFGLFTMLRSRNGGEQAGCTGTCVGCTRNGACENEGAKP